MLKVHWLKLALKWYHSFFFFLFFLTIWVSRVMISFFLVLVGYVFNGFGVFDIIQVYIPCQNLHVWEKNVLVLVWDRIVLTQIIT